MPENLSAHAQRVISLATMEARTLEHSQVGTEHVLLGLLAVGSGGPADVLRTAGASLVAARHKVDEVVGRGDVIPDGEALPFTQRAQRALERAGRFSRQDREPEVSSDHVLLGVLDVEGLACQVLRGLGVDVVQLREACITSLAGRTAERAGESASGSADENAAVPAVAPARPQCPGCRATLDDTLAETSVPARRAVGGPSTFSVLFCAACGVTVGVVRPEST